MADTNKITYVSLENLGYYDGKIKSYIQEKDNAVKSDLEGQLEVVAGALDGEIAKAREEEGKNAAAAQAAKDAADAAQGDVNTLAAKVGTVPEDSTVMGIIANIQENAYDDSELRGLISDLDTNKADKTQVATDIADAVKAEEDARKAAVTGVQNAVDELSGTVASNKTAIEGTVSALDQKVDANEADIEGKMTALTNRVAANETAVGTTLPNAISAEETARIAADDEIKASVKAISDDYLKGADKTELEGKITDNTNAIATLNGEGDGSVKKAIDDAINKFATDVTNDDVVNSYKELIDWAAEHGGDAAEMAEAIQGNTTAIGELEAFIGSLPEGATVSTVIAYIEKLVADEASRATGVEGGLDTRLQAIEAKFTGSGEGSVSEQIESATEAAKNAAIEAAATDSANKDAVVLAEAQKAAAAVQTALEEAIEDLEGADASLKSELEGKINLKADKSALEQEIADRKAADTALETSLKGYADGLNGAMDTKVGAVSDRVTELETFVDSIEFATTEDIDGLFA